jgi:hypothetical protein
MSGYHMNAEFWLVPKFLAAGTPQGFVEFPAVRDVIEVHMPADISRGGQQ